jgi:hypothetical protein
MGKTRRYRLFTIAERLKGVLLMNEPVTKIDPRFSDPDAVATGWEETRRVLVAVWLDGAIHFCTGATEQKAKNLSGNPHVILTTGCNHWEGGLDVVVEGDAVQLTDDDVLERLAEAWATKWDGRWQFLVRDGCYYHHDEHEVLPDAILVFSVTPTKILAFAKGHFNHTRHQF